MSQANDEYWANLAKKIKDMDHKQESTEECEKKGKVYHDEEHKAFRK